MLFICYEKCNTCQKAKKWLETKGLDYSVRDIKSDNPKYHEIKDYFEKSGKPLKAFFNTSGLQYRELGLKDKLINMSQEEQLELLATDGMLVKRPILVLHDKVLVGFKEKEWSEVI